MPFQTYIKKRTQISSGVFGYEGNSPFYNVGVNLIAIPFIPSSNQYNVGVNLIAIPFIPSSNQYNVGVNNVAMTGVTT